MSYHTPVLLEESIQALSVKPSGTYADVTFGGGGHSKSILNGLKGGRLIAFDRDSETSDNFKDDESFIFVQHSFRHLKKFLKFYNLIPLDGVLADLGISSRQIDDPQKGFSTRFDDAPLLMSMGVTGGRNAGTILNEYPGASLDRIFWEYGELKESRRITRLILAAREKSPLKTTGDLKKALAPCIPPGLDQKFLAKVFQALRIEVNNELDELKELLVQSAEVLNPGGRMVVISYHSLEDRLVKTFFSKGKFEGELERDVFGNPEAVPFRVLTKKPILASEKEVLANPRARSAKMRVAEKLNAGGR